MKCAHHIVRHSTTIMSTADDTTTATAPKKPLPTRLTLEEKLWFDRRREEIERYAGFGAGVGGVVTAGITSFGPFNRRMQLATIVGGIVLGGGVGYLWADSKALERIEDLSAQSRLRKEYQQLQLEKKASKAK
ncbi:TPA: hypothetical protein N0F65_007532 [Lagenidium giganteum]|uniref:Uncharacterized protein n=1 Tax=Lagenidium giganteum TaxID=4803 RepID=A0AAV2ZIQ7_9STRA|nr:TPA: hypothetical protein N0F65_007532 [Lagenidium giganteum]